MPCLPLWGRCPNARSAAGADEVAAVRIRRRASIERSAYCTSPGPYAAGLLFIVVGIPVRISINVSFVGDGLRAVPWILVHNGKIHIDRSISRNRGTAHRPFPTVMANQIQKMPLFHVKQRHWCLWAYQYIPPWAAAAAAAASAAGSGLSTTRLSVVSTQAATEAALIRLERVTLVGSTIPASIISTNSSV